MKTLSRFTLDFLKTEAGSGAILAISAFAAIVWANSSGAQSYFALVHHVLPGPWGHEWPVAEWVKECLMAVFFFVVGLEIKYEVIKGELSDPKTLALPVLAALGGMVAPALVYVGINMFGGDLRGWSVPVATDIAFALAVLAMVGKRLPPSLRVFLLTLAIVDDLGAVAIIGIFYNSAFNLAYLAAVAGLLGVMTVLKFVPIERRALSGIYLILFAFVWYLSLKAGLSPSLAAVASAFCVTLDRGLLEKTMHSLHPLVAYAILPAFAFTASGFSLSGISLAALSDPRFLGIALGLFVGKQAGIFLMSWLAIQLNLTRLPEGATFGQLYGVCLLCGIGFTMSLFLGALAFPQSDEIAQNAVKTGVVLGSLLSACAGAISLSISQKNQLIHE